MLNETFFKFHESLRQWHSDLLLDLYFMRNCTHVYVDLALEELTYLKSCSMLILKASLSNCLIPVHAMLCVRLIHVRLLLAKK
jgi:hypothetical protein